MNSQETSSSTSDDRMNDSSPERVRINALDENDLTQIDFAEEEPGENNTNSSEAEDNAYKYYAEQLIQSPKPSGNSANLSMDNNTSVSVSEERLHKESENTDFDAVSKAAENTAPSAEKDFTDEDVDSLSANRKKVKVNYMDAVASGVQLVLSGKIGIENMELCKLEKRRSLSKDNEEKEPDITFCSIANFCLVPITIEHHIYADSDKTFIHIAVFSSEFHGEYRKLRLDAEDIERVGKLVRQKFPQLYYDPDLNSAPKYISTALSIMLSEMPPKNITHFYGWRNFNGRFIYLNDNIDENPLFKSESGKSLLFDPNMFRGDALIYTFRMLKLSKNINKTLPLFLTAHLGVMYSFFELAGYAPRFVLFLRGETGSLKTSISKVFFRFLSDGNNEIPANFNDTMTALEIKMGQTRDEVFLVDDFRPSSMNSELVRMQANLEKLIRFYGDGIGKGRGNISLELRREFKPHSMCAVTGEYIHGTASSLQRLLIVSVDKNTYDRELLKIYQDNPWIFSTHINFFITYLSQNAREIIKYITDKFIEKRAFYTGYLVSKRLVDTAVCMELTAEIILSFYANRCKLVHPMDLPVQLDIWKQSILNFVRESDILANHREPVDMFCAAIAEIAHNAVTKIPPSKILFEQNIKYSLGYYDYDARVLYLKPEESYTEVVQYWTKQGIPFTIKERPLRKMLLMSGLLIGSTDGDSTKTSTPVFINGKTTRMLGFNLTKLAEKYKVFTSPPSPFFRSP